MAEQPDQQPAKPAPAPKPLPTLQYGHKPAYVAGAARKVAMFIGGLLAGFAISAVAYRTAFSMFSPGVLVTMIGVVLFVKIFLAWRLSKERAWQGFGSGLMTSVGLLLLLVGACFGGLLFK